MHRMVLGRAVAVLLVVFGVLALALALGPTASSSAGTVKAHRHSRTRLTATTSDPCTTTDFSLVATVNGTTSDSTVTADGEVDFAADSASADISLPGSFPVSALAGTTLQVLLVGGTAYVAVPPAFSSLAGGASWVSVSLPSGLGQMLDAVIGKLATACPDARLVVSTLESHHGVATSLGSSTIGSTAASGTQVTLSVSEAAQSIGLPSRLLQQIPASLGAASVPVDVWADSQGRLAEISADVRLPTGTSGVSGLSGVSEVSVTLQLTGFDMPVSITAPTGAVPLPWATLGSLGEMLWRG